MTVAGEWQLSEPAYDAEHVPTMVVCCSDGRFIEATQDFLRSRGLSRYDLVAIPGGIAQALYEHEVPGGALSGAQSTELLAKLHHTSKVILMAHADCGYYHHRRGSSPADQQKTDLGSGAGWLTERFPEMTVEALFIRPADGEEGGGFVIEEV
jgi:hypothetical protein